MATKKPKSNELPSGTELPAGQDLPSGGELPSGVELGAARRHLAPAGGAPPAAAAAAPLMLGAVTGADILALARKHIGEKYILGARAPMGNAAWKGPWDCAEFVSWCVFQASRQLFGTEPRNDTMMADAFTGFWAQQARETPGAMIDWHEAASIPGAAVLRKPVTGQIGHIVFSDGQGGTVEAHSSLRGVIASTLSGRRWDCGILVPGVRYMRSDVHIELTAPPAGTLRLTTPLTQGELVRALQKRLLELGLSVGEADGIFGPQTAHAVTLFQARNGLVADGEVGPSTRKALKLAL